MAIFPLNVQKPPFKWRGRYSYYPGNKEPDPEYADECVLSPFVFGDEYITQKIEIREK